MKTIILTLCLLFSLTACAKGNEPDLLAGIAIASQDQVDQNVRAIEETLLEYQLVTQDSPFISTGGGAVNFYYQKNPWELKKIEATLYGEMFQSHSTFFYENEVLLFATDETTYYQTPYTWDEFNMSESRIEKDLFYFDDGELFLWVKPDGQRVEPGYEGFEEKEQAILEDNEELLQSQAL